MAQGRSYAAYIRRSTEDQSDEHQLSDIEDWLDYNDVSVSEVDFYREQASGAKRDREKFNQLIEDIEDGHYTDVVVWEVSRVARHGLAAQRFFTVCEETGTVIHVTNGSVRRIEPEGEGRMVAGIIAEVAAEERRNLIRRTKSGLRRAREDGKWTGPAPTGFTTDDGYLTPNLNPNYDNKETGFLDVVDALERIVSGEWSYNKAAEHTPNITRQTFSNIHQDEERLAWYLERRAEDDRVSEALGEVELQS
ncbi:resolvase [Haloferax sp. MBLA0076]|uniref:Resolvase n=1 Tax=Haloferax litoreum TaxID=2666140 RepID=A0A6A8GHL9_9EURY|nr:MULTISPECIES: recombinase family protein [Haloferax]KAB1193470.1 recombinase family protein [Haloferax sp. CBA1148]MRX21982.1 resolvase [Haloferax litoreum]